MYTPWQRAATVTPPARPSSSPQNGALSPCLNCLPYMRPLLRLTSVLALAGCASTPPMFASAGLGCERAEHGATARSIAIYTRVVAEKVCVVDASGRCHPRVDGNAVRADVRLPSTQQAVATALMQELGRRGILARIARPRGPKTYASMAGPNEHVLELSDIAFSADAELAWVTVLSGGRASPMDGPLAPGGDILRLARHDDVASGGLSRRMVSPVRACWRLERSTSSALAE